MIFGTPRRIVAVRLLAAMLLTGGNTAQAAPLHVDVSGYVDTYWQTDANRPPDQASAPFIYSYSESERPAINLAMVKLALTDTRWRSQLALASGSYMRRNYAAEAEGLQHLFEANLGIKLAHEHDLWLDVGVMPSHIGAESAIGSENWTLTRSLMADNSPYFQTGAKLGYTSPDGRWQLAGFVLTGWQRIHRPNDNSTPALGHAWVYRANDALTWTSSSLIGNEQSDANRQMRYFHHGNVRWQLSPALAMIIALDIGAQQRARDSSQYALWLGHSAMMQYQLRPDLWLAGRIEYYQDRHQVIVSTANGKGLRTVGASLNLDMALTPQVLWRNEVRYLNDAHTPFLEANGGFTNDRWSATSALTFRF